ncbi:MAG: Histidyl-tRNA synthetase, partial [Candidatus Angelobacter sp.]|nr:Histidyl-tRNA synthetase [Candidatus Angelobacter sp.]
MANSIKTIRGTRDILPPDTTLWQHVEQACREIFGRYNFQEIRTPILEDLQLFQRSVGEETDIVAKELYTMEEGTASEKDLKQTWLSLYGKEYEKYEESVGGVGAREIDIVAHKDHVLTLVEIKSRVNLAVVANLRALRDMWQEVVSSKDKVAIAIAAPDNEINKLRQLGVEGVIFQPLPVESSAMQWLALRPENTAGVVRAYIEHKLWERPGLQRFYYIGPQFRRERPQKGRYRQFYQIGAEVIGPSAAGSESPAVDAELLEMLASLLDRLGIQGWSLKLNSVGCADDRPIYLQALRDALKDV